MNHSLVKVTRKSDLGANLLILHLSTHLGKPWLCPCGFFSEALWVFGNLCQVPIVYQNHKTCKNPASAFSSPLLAKWHSLVQRIGLFYPPSYRNSGRSFLPMGPQAGPPSFKNLLNNGEGDYTLPKLCVSLQSFRSGLGDVTPVCICAEDASAKGSLARVGASSLSPIW